VGVCSTLGSGLTALVNMLLESAIPTWAVEIFGISAGCRSTTAFRVLDSALISFNSLNSLEVLSSIGGESILAPVECGGECRSWSEEERAQQTSRERRNHPSDDKPKHDVTAVVGLSIESTGVCKST
jgi:hypothetical protein